MPAPVTVYVHHELVVRESDGATLFLVEAHTGDPDRPLAFQVINPEEE